MGDGATYVARNRKWLAPYVQTLATMMGLPHWDIELKEGWPDEAGTGTICVFRNNNYYTADLYFHEDTYPDDDLRAGIAHELVHLLTRDYDRVVSSVEGQLLPATWVVLSHRVEHEMEQAVDAIARAWAKTLPMPPTTKAAK